MPPHEIAGTHPGAVLADLHRLTTPGAIDETHTVTLGGIPQVVSIRGRRRNAPVLVAVHGGPGTPLSGTSWMWQRPIEETFTVVHHDQRAAGRTHALTDAGVVRPTLRPETYVADLVELLEWVTGHLGVAQVALLGHSWGTVIATQVALARPDLVSVYVGVGQVVSMAQGERVSWTWARAQAVLRGEPTAVAELDALHPYPGERATFRDQVGVERRWVQRFGGYAAGRADCDYFVDGFVLSPDYDEDQLEAAEAGNALTVEVMLPHLLDVDLTHVTSFPVPMVQLLGRFDHMTPTQPVVQWLDRLTAPAKVVEWFEDSAHMAMYEEPGHFHLALVEHVLPRARTGRP